MLVGKQLLYFLGVILVVGGLAFYAGYSRKADDTKILELNKQLNDKIAELDKQMKVLEQERKESQQRVIMLRDSINIVNNETAKHQAEIQILRNSVTDRQEEITRLQANLKLKYEELTKLKTKSLSLEDSLSVADQKIKALTKKIEEEKGLENEEKYTYRNLHNFLNDRIKELESNRSSTDN